MLIIPAIDIRGGKCVRLFQGDYERETVYGDDPAAMAERWISQGARFLHLVDLDGAREGAPRNRMAIRAVLEKVSVPVQVGGGIRDLATAGDYLSSGVHRVIVGTAAISDPGFLREACRRWPGQVAVDVAARKGKAAAAGWTQDTEIRAVDLARRCEGDGAAGSSTPIFCGTGRSRGSTWRRPGRSPGPLASRSSPPAESPRSRISPPCFPSRRTGWSG